MTGAHERPRVTGLRMRIHTEQSGTVVRHWTRRRRILDAETQSSVSHEVSESCSVCFLTQYRPWTDEAIQQFDEGLRKRPQP